MNVIIEMKGIALICIRNADIMDDLIIGLYKRIDNPFKSISNAYLWNKLFTEMAHFKVARNYKSIET